ncbi:glutaminyl-peptide cyclotransferase [Williamwhitmania taraxaci]|uniref:Glutamine cyclotransferase n=1 Tax=Williamwhitmania taraxaci TaxID=1640674 RepID=A0A1G6SJN2_9BACT|nr:glutaminyl-peptide cyclotransferase [Williamwhitmania taraxaci]SDD16884.1 Glutamine cyclotransferase [Williamwhitmania taraxaci]
MKVRFLQFVTVAFVASIISCAHNGEATKSTGNTATDTTPEEILFSLKNAPTGVVRSGDQVAFEMVPASAANSIDSAVLLLDGQRVAAFIGNSLTWNSLGCKMGTRSLRVVAYSGKKTSSETATVKVLPKDAPKQMTCKVTKVYPHDIGAYTQGLVFHEGGFLEGTGQMGESNLRRVELNTGKVLQQYNIPSDIFGEGITVLGDKIFQITWRSNVCFVYDTKTFSLLTKFSYPTEGWGITTVDKQLVMSDGSNLLYYMDPEYFTEKSRLEVFDNEGPVHYLNELEYIDGFIWANVYMTDRIVKIDPKTGAVVADVMCRNLLKSSDKKGNTDVLNGIAYDAKTGRIFITGKYWPKLFEVEMK